MSCAYCHPCGPSCVCRCHPSPGIGFSSVGFVLPAKTVEVSVPAAPAAAPAADPVNHPKHYTSHPARCVCGAGIECIQITEHMGFNIGNVIKYLWRAEEKGRPIEDLEKAAWYLAREIKRRKEVRS